MVKDICRWCVPGDMDVCVCVGALCVYVCVFRYVCMYIQVYMYMFTYM